MFLLSGIIFLVAVMIMGYFFLQWLISKRSVIKKVEEKTEAAIELPTKPLQIVEQKEKPSNG
jgi:hypothetical protein